MNTRRRPARALVALAVTVVASFGVTGCAKIPASNSGEVARPAVTSKSLDAAVAATTSHARIAIWYRHVGPRISSVERAVAGAQHAVRLPGHRGLHSACRVLQARVERVQSARPAPDRTARHLISREMADLSLGAAHCLDNELLAAGRATNLAHHWSQLADARILYVLRHSS